MRLTIATLIILLTMTGCQGTPPKNDAMSEEEKKSLMIQQTPNEKQSELEAMMKENIDPNLLMDQSRLDLETGEIIPDHLKQSDQN